MSPPVPATRLPGKTLAERVRILREFRGLSVSALAERSHLPVKAVEDIESGIDPFLSPAVRQRLAKNLGIMPRQLKAVEKNPQAFPQALSETGRAHLLEEIRHFPEKPYDCPACEKPLIVRLFERRDLDDRPMIEVKAHCSHCLFKL